MTSIFQLSRQTTDEEPEEVAPVFKFLKEEQQKNIIPPVGIADPEVLDAFLQNMDDEEKIKQDVQEFERFKKEKFPETAARNVIAGSVKVGEGFLGGINSFINAIIPPQTFEDESGETETFEGAKLPGAEELHEMALKKHGKIIEPKSEKEKAAQEIESDFGSMLSTPGLSLWNKFLAPIGGQATKQIIKSFGGEEKAQEIGKLGFMALSSIANLGNAQKVASQAINQAEQMIPRGVRFKAQPTEQALANIRNSPWYKTGATASKGPAIQEINRVEDAIRNGTIDAHEAMQLRRDINEARKQLGGFSLNQPVDKKQALKYLNEVDKALIATMENYGTRVNPNWWNSYNRAQEAFRVTQRSRVLSEFIERNAKPLQSQTAKTLFHIAGSSALVHTPAALTAVIPTVAMAKSIQIMNRMIRSPVLRNHYADVLKQAAVGNAAATQKALERFDKIAQSEESRLQKPNK